MRAATLVPLLLLAACTASQQSLPGNPAHGQRLFSGGCAVCHLPDSTAKKVGPGLKGLFQRNALPNGRQPTDDTVAEWVRQGGNGMPPFKNALNDRQMRDLISYLKTL
jgi:mono/diheme cytochrome c family protein